ncbi:MAG TPA: type IV secretion system protein [Streptosporangiaceae bacterium]|nr:type IV secretion system protein [Streptosporangiaceae bacterium]
MLRLRRVSRKAAVALIIVVFLVCATRAVGHGLSVSSAAAQSGAVHAKTVHATTLAKITPDHPQAPAGGLCSVPGIGDIGGLLGFCSLGQSGIAGSLNNLCQPGLPQPESASGGVDSLIKPPDAPGKPIATPYNQYGMEGQFWAATNLQCSDMTSLIGNDVAGMIFDFAKALDRVTITVYQSAAGEGILGWLQGVTDHLISGLGNAIYFPYVAVIVILGAIWLAWQGLIRKRGTRTIEGTIWMVVAAAAAIWLIGRPADFTGLGKGVSDGISTALNAAFAHLPSPGEPSCLPVSHGDPQINPQSFSYTSGRTVVDQNANELWTVLVCKPWLDGEFGTTAYSRTGKGQTVVNNFARPLLWSQAIAVNEKPTTDLIQAKQAAYQGIAKTIQNKDPSVYPLFQGKEWTTRLEIAFAAMLAALVAGVLILLIAVTLILLKLGFLLLLIVGPFFLLIGTHPGFGRVVAARWFEMLVGVLLKQAAVALALSVLLYCYALIMGTTDAVLPWALKILMITLVTVAVFIYRKPFQHLFASVGYSAIGAHDRAEADLSRAAATARANTRDAATLTVPGFAGYRAARWARRNPAQAAGLALGAATAVGSVGAAANLAAGADGGAGRDGQAPPGGAGGTPDSAAAGVAAGNGVGARARAMGGSAGASSGDQAPPLRLPSSQSSPASWSGSAGPAGGSANGGRARPASSRTGGGSSTPPPPAPPALTLGGQPGSRWPSGGGGGGRGSGGGASGGAAPRRPSAAPPSPPSAPSPPSVGSSRTPASSGSGWTGRGQAPRSVRPTAQPTESSRPRSAAPPRARSASRSSAPPSSSASRSGGPFWSSRSGGSGSGSGSGPAAGGSAGPGQVSGGGGAAGGGEQSSPFWLRPRRRRND